MNDKIKNARKVDEDSIRYFEVNSFNEVGFEFEFED